MQIIQGVGRFGTGAATIRTTQDLMLLAGLPPLVRAGDRFGAEVTLRNATNQPMEVWIVLHVVFDHGSQKQLEAMLQPDSDFSQQLELALKHAPRTALPVTGGARRILKAMAR